MNRVVVIPPTTHQIWLGNSHLPEPFAYWRDLMLQLHPGWYHCFWTDENVHELGLKPSDFEHSTFAGSSNIVRLHALKRFGGIYLDCDVEVLKPLVPLLSFRAFAGRQADGPLCNAVMGATPQHTWIQHMIDTYGDQRLTDAAHGCHIMQPAADRFDVAILPTETFYPFSWDEQPDRARITQATLAVHHWRASWTNKL